MEKLLYTVDDALRLVPISRTSLYKAIANGDIESYKMGRLRVFTEQALIDFVGKTTGSESQSQGVTHGR